MNRKLKRMAKRIEGRKPNRSTAKYTTDFQLEFVAFDSIERLFQMVRNGSLNWDSDGWYIMGISGENLHVVSALEGWIYYWKELTDRQKIAYDDAALRRFCKSLEYEKPMQLHEVEAAFKLVELQRSIYRALPKKITTEVTHDVRRLIKIDNEIKDLERRLVA